MKGIKAKGKRIKSCEARVPKDFEFKVLGKLVTDFGFDRSPLDRDYDPVFAAVDLSKLRKAIRDRSVKLLMEVASEFSPQCMLAEYGHRADLFFALYQIGAFLKKFPFNGDLAKEHALQTFLGYERQCRIFNTENVYALLRLNRSHPDYLSIIEDIRRDIRNLLGEAPNVGRVYDCAKHGPGTSAGFEGMEGLVTPYFKWSNLPYTVSSTCYPYAKTAIESNPQWIGALMNHYREINSIPMWSPINLDDFWMSMLTTVDYCRYASVPKNADTERSIAIEPTLNVYLQLGVDRLIRKRLKRHWKIDLNSQEKNQRLAAESAESDENSTLDLKGASEMVTRAVCLLLLPAQWYDLLDDLRSKNIRLPGGATTPLAKISAMGNGFTFALESLIFSAIARQAMKRKKVVGDLAVFGDDLVIPKTVTPFVIDLLEKFGFIINKDKSYVDGPFRESCGVDHLRGYNVRPFFLKKPLSSVQQIWLAYNSLTEMEVSRSWTWNLSFPETKRYLAARIPKDLKGCVGPPSEVKDAYRFSDRKLVRSPNGEYYHWQLTTVPMKFSNRGSDFFFRKLMNQYTGSSVDRLGFTKSAGGSSYDITIRGAVIYKLTERRVW